jgi:CheY-like chemotaxis protein
MGLGPQARRAYQQLHQRISAGQLPPGTKLPPQADLAPALGVSLLTLRQALHHLEQDGLIACEHGRGTFVRAPSAPAVLILEDDAVQRTVLAAHVAAAGYAVVEARTAPEGLAALEREAHIALVLSDLRLPRAAAGLEFIRQVAQRWPGLPLVVVTAYPDDLAPLQGRPEHPVLILTKPVVAAQIAQVLRLTLGVRLRPALAGRSDDSTTRGRKVLSASSAVPD